MLILSDALCIVWKFHTAADCLRTREKKTKKSSQARPWRIFARVKSLRATTSTASPVNTHVVTRSSVPLSELVMVASAAVVFQSFRGG